MTQWDPLRLEHIGRDADDATSLLDEARAAVTLDEAVAALGRAELRQGEGAQLTIYAGPGRAVVFGLGMRTYIHYGRAEGEPADLERLLGEVVAQVRDRT